MIELLIAAGILLFVLGLSLADLNLRRRHYAELDLTLKEAKKIGARGAGGYLDRVFDVVFVLLLATLVQVPLGNYLKGACPLRISYYRIVFIGALSIIPFGLGYLWNVLPAGRTGAIEADLARIGKQKKTKAARLHHILWRPWVGLFYIVYYLWAAVLIYLSLA